MKRRLFIGFMLGLALLSACTQKPQVPELVEGPSHNNTPTKELSAIDTQMWRYPDSALTRLLPWFDTCCRDAACHVSTASAYNRHYANLLLSELLYKNDYPQTNRRELQQAVAYFDSISQVPEPVEGPSNRIAFLDARAHYINGVGYYENDSMVEASAEYLKTLEVMESHFEANDLVGHKARFMAYTYNRLGDMFSDQFMMESSIVCYEKALFYCKIEPTSPQGISNTLTRLGVQYDKLGDKEKMRNCYEQALEAMPSSDNLSYRDLAASKALCDYQLGLGIDHSLAVLRRILVDANDEEERKTRFLTVGAIFAEEGIYDSAMYYLEPLFENEVDLTLKISAAECLRSIYDSIGDDEKLDKCLRFMALQKKSEAQNKALVSQLDDLFKSYTNQKLQNEAEKAREKSIRKTIEIIVPIAVAVSLVIFVMAKLRGKKQLRDKEEHHQREMESERQAHKMQQAALSGRLKRSNEELRDVSSQLEQMLAKNVSSESVFSDDYKAFVNTPICLYIVDLVHTQQFKSKMDYLIYKDNALSKEQLLALRDTAGTNLPRFVSQIRKQFPRLTDNDMDYCYLFLLGLTEADISALMQRAYTTVCDRSRKISRIIGANESLYHTLRNMLSE